MPFSESVLTFVANRPNATLDFRTGQWLASLDNDQLTRLTVLTEEFALQGPAPHHDDVIFCAIQASLAEGGGQLTPDDVERISELVSTLAFLAGIESLARHGWIEIVNETSVLQDLDQGSVRITDLGWEHKDEFKLALH